MKHEIKRHPAEELLIQEGVRTIRSQQLRTVLGCVGCRWLNAEQNGEQVRFYGYEIRQCTDRKDNGINRVKGGVVHPILNRLTEAGVLEAERDNSKPSIGPSRVYFYPADSELGKAFRTSLEGSENCDLEEG